MSNTFHNNQWCKKWRIWCGQTNLELNTLKTEEMRAAFRRRPPTLPPITILKNTVSAISLQVSEIHNLKHKSMHAVSYGVYCHIHLPHVYKATWVIKGCWNIIFISASFALCTTTLLSYYPCCPCSCMYVYLCGCKTTKNWSQIPCMCTHTWPINWPILILIWSLSIVI